MDDNDNHSMIFVREIEIVLVHRERDAPFRRLDEHLRMVCVLGLIISAARSVWDQR